VGPGYEGLFAQVIFPSARMSLNIKKKLLMIIKFDVIEYKKKLHTFNVIE